MPFRTCTKPTSDSIPNNLLKVTELERAFADEKQDGIKDHKWAVINDTALKEAMRWTYTNQVPVIPAGYDDLKCMYQQRLLLFPCLPNNRVGKESRGWGRRLGGNAAMAHLLVTSYILDGKETLSHPRKRRASWVTKLTVLCRPCSHGTRLH